MDKRNHARRGAARWSVSAGMVASAAALFASGAAGAADGELDPTFGTGGIAMAGLTTATFELPSKPLVLADGRILVCSGVDSGGPSGTDFFIERFNVDGSPDTTFNFDGKVTIDFDSRRDGCNALAVQADGKIIAVGTSADTVDFNGDFAIARLDEDGTLDPTFGAGTGESIVPFDLGGTNSDTAGAVAMQPDGKIVVSGWATTGATGYDFAVVRLLPDGTRDTTFNSTGRVTVAFDFAGTDGVDQCDAVLVDDDGNILLGGIAEVALGSFDFAVARLLPTGQLDHNFDADGRATIGFDLGNTASDISYQTILQRDGKIVMVGAADSGSGTINDDVAIARLLGDGSPDPDFGVGGKVTVPFDLITNGNEVATGVVEDSAGRIVVVGAAVADASSNFRSFGVRLLADGTLDASFGAFGKKVYDFGGDADLFTGVAMQGTQIIAFGQTTTGSDVDDFVTRLQVDLIFANGFE